MAEPLKNMYSRTYFNTLCPVLMSVIPQFDSKKFIRKIFSSQWPSLELKQRVRHISVSLHDFLPKDFEKAAQLLVQLSNKLLNDGIREQSFTSIFIPDYIEVYGLDHPEVSLKALGEITKLVSAEFAIRPFILRYPDKTMKYMTDWSKSKHASVRRLSSEGCRPRLPWAMGIPFLKKDPSSILPILENLKADPSEYVRRSVANNLNDIAKDHPGLVLTIADQWKRSHPDTDWILKHGCRTLLKRGDSAALLLHGFKPESKFELKQLSVSAKEIRIGEGFDLSFSIRSKETEESSFRIEYKINFLTSSKKRSTKIFRVTERILKPNEVVAFSRRHSFKNLTTRKHFPGKHSLTIVVNGQNAKSVNFQLI
jgi:3-methyladenine DNA glycosylase AlkC